MNDKSEEHKEPNPLEPPPTIPQLTAKEIYQLTEIKILQEIESKFFEALTRKARFWGITVAIAAFVAGAFGVSSFWSQIHSFIQSTAKNEVDQRLASEFPRLESRIDETFQSGILAKNASDKATQTLDSMTQSLAKMNASLTELQSHTDIAKTNWQDLEGQIVQQSADIARLETILKGWFKNSKTDMFDFSKDPLYVCAVSTNGSRTLVCFALSSIPVEGSLRLQYHVFAQPPGSFWNHKNLVFFVWGESLDNLRSHQCFASYVADPTMTNIIQTV
jgi:hypothetical protein